MSTAVLEGHTTQAPSDGSAGSAGSAGVAPLLVSARRSLFSARERLAVDEPDGNQAIELLAAVADIVKIATSVKLSLVTTVAGSGAFRGAGHRSAASMLSAIEGIPQGAANSTVGTANRLGACPEVDDAMRRGELSEAQAKVITEAAVLDPGRQHELVEAAATSSLTELADRCRQIKASSAKSDPMAAYRRIHQARSVTSWTDEEGAFCLKGRFTPDVGATLAASLEAVTNQLFEEARQSGSKDPLAAYRADALAGLIGGERDPVHSGVDIHVIVDHQALLRGHPEGDERSEIEGVGPIPVPRVRDLMTDAGLRVIFAHGTEISKVFHFKRTINAVLATALGHRDRTCVVPGCGATRFLEIDHVHPFAEGGPTTLSNLARLCSWHHRLKSNDGWTLTHDDNGGWRFDPPPPFGEEPELVATPPPG